MNLEIQILAGNTLMSRFHVGFEIELSLEVNCRLKANSKKILGPTAQVFFTIHFQSQLICT